MSGTLCDVNPSSLCHSLESDTLSTAMYTTCRNNISRTQAKKKQQHKTLTHLLGLELFTLRQNVSKHIKLLSD